VVSRYAEVSRAVPFEKLSPNYRRGIETLFTQFTVVMRSRDDLSRLLNAADYQSLTDEGRHCSARANVRFGSLADIGAATSHVRFTPERGHVQCIHPCLLWAISGHHRLTVWMWPQSLHLKKCTGDPVVGLSHVSLNSSSPPQRGQRLFWVSVDCKAVPLVSRQNWIAKASKASTQQGLVIAGQKAGHPCPKTRLPSYWAEGQHLKAHILRRTFAKKAIRRCHSRPIE